jgi:predicted amidophosphoribosyltransferase
MASHKTKCVRCGKKVDPVRDLCAGCRKHVCVDCVLDGHHWGFDIVGDHVLSRRKRKR